jgi:WhiB family redox-sensing transcriptional regulator
MRTTRASDQGRERPTFYTVAEAARLLRVDPATIYRAIREDAFPAVRVRSRYVIPVAAVDHGRAGRRNRNVCRRGRDRVHAADRSRGRPRDRRSAMNRHDERSPDVERRAAELDGLSHVPTELLLDLVEQRGTCWWEVMSGDPPTITDEAMPDRALAARLCAGCPVQRECLELELRTEGAATTGVWGALCEVDRRALHTLGQARRTRGHAPRRHRRR